MLSIMISGAEVRAGAIVIALVLAFHIFLWWVRRRARKGRDFE